MRLYSAAEIDRLRLIKHLVEERGVNLAGVRHLLSVFDGLDRLQRLATETVLERRGGRARLRRELDRLRDVVGLP